METTRHFTATMYLVDQDATVLHEHERLGLWLPPGGHLHRDELPHEAALREAHEETGLRAELVQKPVGNASETARQLPEPATLLLEDINIHGDAVGHQHVDFIYYGRVSDRTVSPVGEDEASADRWEWFGREDLAMDDRIDPDVRDLGIDAIGTVSAIDDSAG